MIRCARANSSTKMKQLLLIAVFVSVTSAISLRFDAYKKIQFDLYTLRNPTTPQILKINDTNSIDESNFNREVPTRIFIHGWQGIKIFASSLTRAYFTKGNKDVNLIGVNWAYTSNTPSYTVASRYVERVGIHTAKFIDFMMENQAFNSSEITVIGLSLGAHCAGIAGKRVRLGRIGKIVGLDPAAPHFPLSKPNKRLDSQDALYVETIQTDDIKFGYSEPIGTVSIYPNGGRAQPHCARINFLCSHVASNKYFLESIYSEPMVAYKCDSLNDMKKGNCSANGQQVTLGGEPGAMQQPAGIYHISIVRQKKSILSKLSKLFPWKK